MNNKKESIIAKIGASQDGKKLYDDVYGRFLTELIEENTDESGFVDADELRDNLQYAISEFHKAMKSIEVIADRIKAMKERPEPTGPFIIMTAKEFADLIGGTD